MFFLFIQGLIIGFAISAPVGPIGMLCIQQSLQNGFKIGLITGLGAATADNLYGLIAAFSITAISSFLNAYHLWLRILGGLCLIIFGLKLCLSKSSDEESGIRSVQSMWSAYATGVILTLTNPITFLSFMAIFSALGLGSKSMDYIQALMLVSGILVGSTTWWLFLSGGVAFYLKDYITLRSIKVINWISGVTMVVFGIYAAQVIFW